MYLDGYSFCMWFSHMRFPQSRMFIADHRQSKAEPQTSEPTPSGIVETGSAPSLDNAKFLSASPPETRVSPPVPAQL